MVNRHPFRLFFLVALIVGLSLCWSVQDSEAQVARNRSAKQP